MGYMSGFSGNIAYPFANKHIIYSSTGLGPGPKGKTGSSALIPQKHRMQRDRVNLTNKIAPQHPRV